MRYVLVAIFIAFIVANALCIAWLYPKAVNAKVVLGYNPQITLKEVKRRMKYHGTLFAMMEDDGSWVFYRHNKKCKLW